MEVGVGGFPVGELDGCDSERPDVRLWGGERGGVCVCVYICVCMCRRVCVCVVCVYVKSMCVSG